MQGHEALLDWGRRSYVCEFSRHPKPVLFPDFLGGFSCAQLGLAGCSNFHKKLIVIGPLALEESGDDGRVESVVGNVVVHPLDSLRVWAGGHHLQKCGAACLICLWRYSYEPINASEGGKAEGTLVLAKKKQGLFTCKVGQCSSKAAEGRLEAEGRLFKVLPERGGKFGKIT